MGKVLIGTCGYDYPEDWAGVFYPRDLKRDKYLSFYADNFNAVEINSIYYRPPTVEQMKNFAARSEGRLMFSIKADQELTHAINPDGWEKVADVHRKALAVLQKDNLLSALLLQFPQSFHYDDDNRRYLGKLLYVMKDVPIVVEFRHNGWQLDSVYTYLNDHGIGSCMVDLPQVSKLPSFKPVITGGNAYMRFHGRNMKNWYGTNAKDRYDYLYSDDELSGYVPTLKTITNNASLVQIFFNNHAKGQAAVNAKKLMLLMEE